MPLKYLFEAHFTDGTMFQQTQDDVCSFDPAKSAFTDVLQRIEEVTAFGIYNDDHTYAVDLSDGHFEIDGTPFSAFPADFPHEEPTVFRLIYFRRNRHMVAVGADGVDPMSHTVEYFIGWQTTVNGKNYQQTISVF